MNKQYLLLHLLYISTMVCIDYCSNDNALTYFKSELQNLFKMAPKLWHMYIRMFVHRYYKHNQIEVKNIQD